MEKKRKHTPSSAPDYPRNKKITCLLSDEEYSLVCGYLEKYKIANRSRWYRETILSHVLKTLEKDYPTLFGENEMRR
jgi:hypothetical protein